MKVLLKSLFLVITLSIISYSAVAAGFTDTTVTEIAVRRCCTYQSDCLDNQTCKTIDPACSALRKNQCENNVVTVEPVADAETAAP